MSARATVPVLAIVAAAAALAFLAPQQQPAPTPAQALVRRIYDLETAILQEPANDSLLLAKVDAFRQARLSANALNVCRAPRQGGRPGVCNAMLLATLIYETNEQRAAEADARGAPRVFTVAIGITRYQRRRMPDVPYAAADARLFAQHVQAPRPSVRLGDVFLLIDETATAKRIREALDTVLGKAGPRDVVHIFVSAHGVTEASPQDGFLMAYDSDPQEMPVSAYRISDLRKLLDRRAPSIGQILLYADLCRTAPFQNHSNLIQVAIQQQLENQGARFAAMLAGSSGQPTLTTNLDGGHGVFGYHLLQGLRRSSGLAVSVDELFPYVRGRVVEDTKGRQRPLRFGSAPRISGLRPWLRPPRSGAPPVLAFGFLPDEPSPQAAPPPQDELLLQPGLAFDVASGPEDEGQQVILNYLQGNEVPQTKADFDRGANWFRLAREIKPSDRVTAREAFCLGRSATFERRYGDAVRLLGDAIRLEPDAAYAHNALGIAHLMSARTDEAIDSFNEAIRRAPFWIYPRHNLALARSERGDFRLAEQEFLAAIRIDPTRAHLHYSLGVLYQRRGRTRDARDRYRAALALRNDQPEAHAGMGAILAGEGKTAEADKAYNRALALNPALLAARHDLGLLYAVTDPARAIDLWDRNLRIDGTFAPSRLSLARALRDVPGRLEDSAAQYALLLKTRGNMVGARVEYAKVLQQLGRPAEARAQLEAAVQAEPLNFSLHEEFGDILAAQGDPAAKAEFNAAAGLATERSDRRRIGRKLARLP